MLAAAAGLTAGATPSSAAELTGRLSSEIYVWERDGETHLRPYERLQSALTFWRGTDGRSLSLHTHARWMSDLSEKLPGDPQLFVYDAYLKTRGLPRNSEMRLGRQFVYTAAGSALLDGFRMRYGKLYGLDLDIFAGTAVSSDDPEKIQSFSDWMALGWRLSHRCGMSTHIGLNWMLRKSNGSVGYHRAALDGQYARGQWHLYARTGFNLAVLDLAELLARISYAPDRWLVTAEFHWREPAVPANSLFSLIGYEDYRVARLNVERRIVGRLSLLGYVINTFIDGGDALVTGLGFRTGIGTLTWQHHGGGYRGESDRLVGNAYVRLGRRWDVYASAQAGTYKIQPEQAERSDAYAGSLGAVCRLGRGFTARVEGQFLRNAVRSDDARLFVRIQKAFALRPAKEGGDR